MPSPYHVSKFTVYCLKGNSTNSTLEGYVYRGLLLEKMSIKSLVTPEEAAHNQIT